jgi:hypothetical protein
MILRARLLFGHFEVARRRFWALVEAQTRLTDERSKWDKIPGGGKAGPILGSPIFFSDVYENAFYRGDGIAAVGFLDRDVAIAAHGHFIQRGGH